MTISKSIEFLENIVEFFDKNKNRLKIKNNFLARHLIVGSVAIVLASVFWFAHYEWNEDMRLWRAFGDAGYALLFMTWIIGPLINLWPRFNFLLTWRREFGI